MESRLSHGGEDNLGPWRKGEVVLAGQKQSWKGRRRWPKINFSCTSNFFIEEEFLGSRAQGQP